MNETGPIRETEVVYRRLSDSVRFFGESVDGQWWLAVLIPVLIIGFLFVAWMYWKDSRTIRWYWATLLAGLRLSVYSLLVFAFLLPAKQTWERTEKSSRVLIALDLSESMTVSDDLPTVRKPTSRLQKVLDLLTDDRVAFLHKIIEKNPISVYRFGSRLDEEPQQFEAIELDTSGTGKSKNMVPIRRVLTRENGTQAKEFGSAWNQEDWQAFIKYDFKPWILSGISTEAAEKLKSHVLFEGDKPGSIAWARSWSKRKVDEISPTEFSEADQNAFKSSLEKLKTRIEVAESIGSATNVSESMLSLINREAGNMIQGIIVFSDGRSNLGSDAVVQELKTRTKRENIPIFTVLVGEDRAPINVRISDVQAPEQTPPGDPFKVIVEVDGEGLVGKSLLVNLDLYLPQRETPFNLPVGSVQISAGEPPHGQVEFIIDPKTLPEELRSKSSNYKEMIEGEWRVVARIARVEGERFPDKEHVSEPFKIQIIKKPIRVLVMASGPVRDFQFLINQLIRDKADISIFLQNEGGQEGKINLLDDPERLLVRFPDRLRVDDDAAAKPEEKWYNLARYDAIIAFDPDWSKLQENDLVNLQNWVEINAGGLLYVAGSFHTKQLARADDSGRYKPILDLLPVQPGDIDLAKIRRSNKEPWRLTFQGVNPESEYLKLDDDISDDPIAGWSGFFTGKAIPTENDSTLRGFYGYYPVDAVKPGATVIARFTDPEARGKDGKDAPFLVQMKIGQGMVIFLGSPEIWRLRQYREIYFERFWTKMTRFVASGSQRKQDRRGRILMQREFSTGGYIRVLAQLLDSDLKPASKNSEPKITILPVELDDYQTRDKDKENQKYKKEFRLQARKGPDDWAGYFARQIMATPEQYPPGQWRIEIDVPSSAETLKHRIMIRRSNPELDIVRPDAASMIQLAGDLEVVAPRIQDKAILDSLKASLPKASDGQRLAFRLDRPTQLEAIPSCLITETKTQRNRGPIEDQWDRGPELPSWMTSWYSDKPQRVGWLLLLIVGLLSAEWTIRKLLRLA
jgi:hypothetical protein